jgi:UDP-N-acetylglucosamine 4,6-dehydratase
LLIGDNVSKTSHPRIMRAEETMIPWSELEQMLQALQQATKNDDFEQIRVVLQQAVSGFVPQCEIGDLLWQQRKTTYQ